MGLTFQLIPTLLCLLACTSDFVCGHKCDNTLQETIKILNNLTEKTLEVNAVPHSPVPAWTKRACTELTVADAFAAQKNTTENETFCRAASVLQQFYKHHHGCFRSHLRALVRSLRSMTSMTDCSMNEAKMCTLKDLLERLKMIMKEKYSKCRRIF